MWLTRHNRQVVFARLLSPDNQLGKLWLSVGTKEAFSIRDLKDFPTWRRTIRQFHEVDGAVDDDTNDKKSAADDDKAAG